MQAPLGSLKTALMLIKLSRLLMNLLAVLLDAFKSLNIL